MRKYQQLILIIVSIISVSVLIAYRSENERLQHVLSVVNFFGQRDISLVKIENFSNFTYKFDYPLPTWSYLGNEFHAYSAFWKKNDLVAGGEAIALAIGSVHGNVLFQVRTKKSNDVKFHIDRFCFPVQSSLHRQHNRQRKVRLYAS